MKRFALCATLGLAVTSPLLAASLDVIIGGGQATTYQLESIAVDANGNVIVRGASGSGGTTNGYTLTVSAVNGTYSRSPAPPSGGYTAGTQVQVTASPNTGYSFTSWTGCDSVNANVCSVTMTANKSVSATFTSTGGGTGGGDGAGCTSSSTLTCVDTKLPSSPFSRVAYKPDPEMVYAFKVTAPTGAYYGSGTATRQVGADSAKLIVISETPGDVTTTGKSYGCVAQGTESTRINFAINQPSASTFIYCPMTAGKTYYINVSSYSKWNPGSLTCNSSSSCGFYFEGR